MVEFGANKGAQEPVSSHGENVVTATSYIGVKANGAVDKNEPTETELYKTQVEKEGRVHAGVNAAEEYLEQLKETAKNQYDRAGEALKGTAEKAQDYVKDSASSLNEKLSEKEHAAAEKARRMASGSTDRLKQFPDQVEGVAAKSFLSLSSLVPTRVTRAREDLVRSWTRFKSKCYTPARALPNAPTDPIQALVRKMKPGKKSAEEVKQIVDKIRDVLQDKGEDVTEGARNAYYTAKEKVASATDFDTVSDALKQAPSNASPRDFWRSVHNHLDHHGHPLATPISSLSYSPIPVTSLYLGAFTLTLAYTFSRRLYLTKEVEVTSTKNSQDQTAVVSTTILSYTAESFGWTSMAFLNLLVLELNGYSALVVFSVALISLFGQLVDQYSAHAKSQDQARCAILGAVLVSAVLNTLTAITGSPVL